MSFVAAAVIGGGISLLGGALSANAAGRAAGMQAGAANNATQAQLQMFNTVNKQQAPYRQAGYSALDEILRGLGLGGGLTYDASGNITTPGAPKAPTKEQFTKTTPGSWSAMFPNGGNDPRQPNPQVFTPGTTKFDQAGYDQAMANYTASLKNYNAAQGGESGGIPEGYFSHQFGPEDLKTNLAPNYQFMLDQGLRATTNAGNLQTGLLSGNTLKGLNDYAQNYASNGYQQAFNNYTSQQTNIFNRLSNIAGLGQTANQATGNAAVATGQGIASSMQNAGAAQAAGAVGQANAITGGLNNALGWFSLPQLMNMGSGGNV